MKKKKSKDKLHTETSTPWECKPRAYWAIFVVGEVNAMVCNEIDKILSAAQASIQYMSRPDR